MVLWAAAHPASAAVRASRAPSVSSLGTPRPSSFRIARLSVA